MLETTPGGKLGKGASGTVFHASLTQQVALKRANQRPRGKHSPEEAAAFNKRCQRLVDGEAEQLGRFGNHPYIVRPLGLIQEAGRIGPSIVMEFATHGSLADWMRDEW